MMAVSWKEAEYLTPVNMLTCKGIGVGGTILSTIVAVNAVVAARNKRE